MKPNIGLEAKNIKGSISLLTESLANTQVLFIKTQGFHWNVPGPSFMEMHVLFEKQYIQLKDAADEIAERIRQLGEKSEGTMKEFLNTSKIKETAEKNLTAIEMTKELLEDHEFIIRELRKAIEKSEQEYEDAGTTDFLTDLLQRHEKTAWVLREYSEKT